ncbi:MAG: type II toxin-antitoxin system VapC family toxin [Sphingomonadaceae bacterium]|nr:type II toxin-antitoxin system VapC family toxin [Sphingomonadaceae bacterium]
MIILDSSAVLALLWNEPGEDRVVSHLSESTMSTVNHSEVLARLIDRGPSPKEATKTLEALRIGLIAFDRAQCELAGMLRSTTAHLGLSLGDRACLALAMITGRPVLTADRPWAELDIGVDIRLIR